MKSLALVLLGSNMGDRRQLINSALEELQQLLGKADRISKLYETSSWGIEDQPDFLNCVAGFHTTYNPIEVLKILLDIEKRAGRVRGDSRYESRTIDLDLLLYDDVILHEPGLQIPHPRMTQRRFTMVPLAEIYPKLNHPEFNCTMLELLRICPDSGTVKEYVS